MTPGAFLRVDDLLTLFSIHGHRFFGDDIASEFHAAADVFVVSPVHGGDDHLVRLDFGDHPVEIAGFVSRQGLVPVLFPEKPVPEIHPVLVCVAQRAEFAAGGMFLHQGRGVHP